MVIYDDEGNLINLFECELKELLIKLVELELVVEILVILIDLFDDFWYEIW